LFDDQAGSGAVPLWRANALSDRKRRTPAVSPRDLGGGERPAAADRKQRRSELLDESLDLGAELRNLDVERTTAVDEVACDPRNQALEPIEPNGDLVERTGSIQ
jgi:hypothetical protein